MGRQFVRHILRVSFVSLLALSEPMLEAKPPQPTWFPLESGNQWVMASTNLDSRTILCAPLGNGLWSVTGLFDNAVTLRSGPGGNINLQVSATGHAPWQTGFRFGPASKASWRFNLAAGHCGDFRADWVAGVSTVTTPAGTFLGCRHWQCQRVAANNCPAISTTDLWLAPGVGPVALQTGDGELFLLTAATVGATTYPPQDNGLAASLTPDASVYTNVTDHAFVCPPCTTNNPPCEMPCYLTGGSTAIAHFTLAVTNNSADTLTFTFPTTNQYDVRLSDSNGVVVADWGIGKPFADVVTTITLTPGGFQDFVADMPLVDRSFNRLSGAYTARGFLTNTNGPAGVTASTSISVYLLLAP